MTKSQAQANAAYIASHTKAVESIAYLAALVENMPAPGTGSQIGWPMVGTLGEVNARVAELVEMLRSAK